MADFGHSGAEKSIFQTNMDCSVFTQTYCLVKNKHLPLSQLGDFVLLFFPSISIDSQQTNAKQTKTCSFDQIENFLSRINRIEVSWREKPKAIVEGMVKSTKPAS